jgi:SAM-dependent methyltransferase
MPIAVIATSPPMPPVSRSYELIADIYERRCEGFAPAAAEAVSRLFGPASVRDMRLLDVCCGAGQVAAEFAGRGAVVTGVDGAAGLLARAARRIPDGRWVAGDVTRGLPAGPFDAAMATLAAVNDVMRPVELGHLFKNVFSALQPGAIFAFDFKMREAYEREEGRCTWTADADHAMMVRTEWHADTRTCCTCVTGFLRDVTWTRADAEFSERCYDGPQLWALLSAAGFTNLAFWPARTLGITGDLAHGRCFVRAMVPEGH